MVTNCEFVKLCFSSPDEPGDDSDPGLQLPAIRREEKVPRKMFDTNRNGHQVMVQLSGKNLSSLMIRPNKKTFVSCHPTVPRNGRDPSKSLFFIYKNHPKNTVFTICNNFFFF